MARPRIFISSTFYDLKAVRFSISSFVQQMGYDPILNEHGAVTYGKDKPLDQYCYDEVSNCDVLVCIVGGRFGASASDNDNSITQTELKTALNIGKQVYIFVEKATLSEYQTYKINKGSPIKWAHADSDKIFEFIESLYELPVNNAIFSFDNAGDIVSILKEQWAGLFQRYLAETPINGIISTAKELNEGLTILSKMMSSSSVSSTPGSNPFAGLIDHPAFSRLQKLLNVKYRIFFLSYKEMSDWLTARNYFEVDEDRLDSPDESEWILEKHRGKLESHPLLKISRAIFDKDGQLIPSSEINWDDKMIRRVMYDPSSDSTPE